MPNVDDLKLQVSVDIKEVQNISHTIYQQAVQLVDNNHFPGYAQKNPRVLASTLDLCTSVYTSKVKLIESN